MNKIDALESIKLSWNDKNLKLGQKIITISTEFYSAGLDLAGTAAFINATPAELDSFLGLSSLDEDILDIISEINPPETTWIMLSNANEKEIRQALLSLEKENLIKSDSDKHFTFSEYVFQKMIEISGPTREQRVSNLSSDDIAHALKKGLSFNVLDDFSIKFMKSIISQKKRGKVLTDKQALLLTSRLELIISKDAIKRDSIDGDQDICNRILDAMGN